MRMSEINRTGIKGSWGQFMEWCSNTVLFLGTPTSGMKTALQDDGKPMIFLHNPKCAGTAIGKYLGVKRRSHTYASKRVSLKWWLSTFSLVIVRDPVERFFSAYYGNMKKGHETFLAKKYGAKLLKSSPLEFLDLVKENPKLCGPQTLWTDYPSTKKPRADLVVKFEELVELPTKLRSLGIKNLPTDIPMVNVGVKREKGAQSIAHAEILGLGQRDYKSLLESIKSYYADDYREFGYQQN